jgi:hypothetical protein
MGDFLAAESVVAAKVRKIKLSTAVESAFSNGGVYFACDMDIRHGPGDAIAYSRTSAPTDNRKFKFSRQNCVPR